MEFFLEKWCKDFIKKFDCFVICYFTDAPITLSALLHNYNSCNHFNHIFPIQTKNNSYQIVRIYNHKHIPFVLVLFQYDSI